MQAMKDTALAIEERLYWECRANGKPKPSYTWLKNGQQLLSEVNYCSSSATYQCFVLMTQSSASARPFRFKEPGVKHEAVFFQMQCTLRGAGGGVRCAGDETWL